MYEKLPTTKCNDLWKKWVPKSHLRWKINKFWNIKNICNECLFKLFAQVRDQVLRSGHLKISEYLSIPLSMITKSWVYYYLFWFYYHQCIIQDDFFPKLWVSVQIALILKINWSHLLGLNMGTLLIYDMTDHKRQAVSLEGLWFNTNWIQPGRAG